MRRFLVFVGLSCAAVVACSPASALTPSPAATPAPSASAAPSGAFRELPPGTADLPPARYGRGDLLPGVSVEVGDGWSSGVLGDGSLELRTAADDGDVVMRLARVDGASAADDAAATIQALPGIRILATSESRMSGLTGPNLELEATAAAPVQLLDTASTPVALRPGERAWMSLFDTTNGVIAVAVTSDSATWDAALVAAEPLLESVVIAP